MASSTSFLYYVSLVGLFIFFNVKPLYGFDINDVLSPILSPVFDDICEGVECGKGSCKASRTSTFFFECECENGWRQTTSNSTQFLKFLPCVIPNCTMNSSCTKVPAPVDNRASKPNQTIFDPCYWSYCGSGYCNKTSDFTYNCECAPGFYNLLNISGLPCFQSCELGMDCPNLGFLNTTTGTNPTFSGNSENQGEPPKSSSSTQEHSIWLMMITMALVEIILSKYN